MATNFLEDIPQELSKRIKAVCERDGSALKTFEDLYNYAKQDPELRKKIKGEEPLIEVPQDAVIFQLKDVSVLTPFRKKLDLVISVSPTTGKPALSLSKDMVPQLSITQLNTSVKFATFLPFPEKKNMAYLFICYVPEGDPAANEFVLVTLNKDATVKQFQAASLLNSESAEFSNCVEYIRKQAILVGFRISDPFSAASGATPSFHVEAHRGTKEGTLYFLPDHVLFGFKKPILLFSSQEIESITYSSITRLTFNVTLITKSGDKFEFSMIDQNEYTLIDDYVKRKQVIDNSMSEENKAKSAHKDQNATEHASLLEEAAQQLKGEGNVGDIPLESDDEEADVDFEVDSSLSDGSDSGSGSDQEDQEDEEEGSASAAEDGSEEPAMPEKKNGPQSHNIALTTGEPEEEGEEEEEEEEEEEIEEAVKNESNEEDENEEGQYEDEEDSGVEYD
ncbi:LAQU0S05e04962g1_1 [Lachancea quebecensis]|uniref:Histone chaperone RTT106 n=1 Tax=Lachancea quebecensis TaxID=1654605 RepID=A0A0P1KRN0_9SACH|nr:LAQU0S05e04962g1_1 [Lachancea quebecensis]